VGLSISQGSIEIVQCSKNDEGEVAFERYLQVDLDATLVDEDGDITNPDALGALLAQIWKDENIGCRQVVLGFSGKRAIARLVSLPRIPANQLQQVILSEAEQYTLFRDEEPLVDYFTVDTDMDSSTVFYAAASQKLVNAYKRALRVARLNLLAIDIAQYASLRALVHFKLSDADVWDGVIVMPGRLVITSWFGQKLLNWREVSSQRWEEEAEDQRYQFIETELSRTLRLDADANREILVAKDSLAESARMCLYFQRHTDLPLQATGIDFWCRRMAPEALEKITPAALGLGLWGLETRIPSLDLLHRSGSKNEFFASLSSAMAGLKLDRSAGVAAAIAAGTFAAGLGGLWYLGAGVLGDQNRLLTNDISSLGAGNAILTTRVDALTKENATNQQILDLIGPQAATNLSVSFMTQVNDIVPSDAWLYSLESPSPDKLVLKGGANSQSAGLTLARKITEFIEIGQVKVADMQVVGPNRYAYTIEVAIDPTLGGGAGASPVSAAGAAGLPPGSH
jgi:hypothetical protein